MLSLVVPSSLALDIQYNNQVIKANTETNFNFFVYNNSLVLDNTTTSCLFKLFNKEGVNLDIDNLKFNTTINTFWINKSLNSGSYFFNVNCNTSSEGAYNLISFDVTDDGKGIFPEAESITSQKAAWILAIILLIAFFFIWLAATQEDGWSAILAGFLIVAEGVYIIRYGFAGADPFLNDVISVILIGFGAYIGFRGIEATAFGENFPRLGKKEE